MQQLGHHLVPVEPQAAQTAKHPGLNESYPASMQLHDDCKGAVGRQDDVVDHGGVVADPDVVGAVDGAGAVVSHHPCPRCHKHATLELYQGSLPGQPPSLVLQPYQTPLCSYHT